MNDSGGKKPEIPSGKRLLQVGERIEKGDLKWDGQHKKWVEIGDVMELQVSRSREGFYCR